MRAGRRPDRRDRPGLAPAIPSLLAVVFLAAIFSALLPPAAAAAPQSAVTPGFAHFLASEEHRQIVLDTARRHSENVPNSCKSMSFALAAQVTIYAPVRIEGGKPVEGAWAEPVMGTGCGKSIRFTALTIVAPGKAPVTLSLIPGDTRADPVLQRDSVKDVLDHVAAATGGCKELVVTDTRFDDWEGPAEKPAAHGRETRPWREVWTVWACGKLVEVPIHFTPNGAGTLYEVKSAEVKPRP
jgi:hypothetical protein